MCEIRKENNMFESKKYLEQKAHILRKEIELWNARKNKTKNS